VSLGVLWVLDPRRGSAGGARGFELGVAVACGEKGPVFRMEMDAFPVFEGVPFVVKGGGACMLLLCLLGGFLTGAFGAGLVRLSFHALDGLPLPACFASASTWVGSAPFLGLEIRCMGEGIPAATGGRPPPVGAGTDMGVGRAESGVGRGTALLDVLGFRRFFFPSTLPLPLAELDLTSMLPGIRSSTSALMLPRGETKREKKWFLLLRGHRKKAHF